CVGGIAVEIEQRRPPRLRGRMPGDKRGAVGRRELYLRDTVEPRLGRRNARRIGEIHKGPVTEIGQSAKRKVDGDQPEKDAHDLSPEVSSRRHAQKRPLAPAAMVTMPSTRLIATMRRI